MLKRFYKNNYSRRGSVLVLTVIVMMAILMLVTYFLNAIISDYQIAKSQMLSEKTYYLTEAGLNEAIWKIKNDAGWNGSFKTNPTWQTSISRNNVFENGLSYQVSIKNKELAKAEVIATGTLSVGNNYARRVVKTTVFQAQGQSATSGVAIFTDQGTTLNGVNITVNNGGGIFSRTDLNLYLLSNLTLAGKAQALGQINVQFGSQLHSNGKFSANFPPVPTDVPMPQVDFDSADAQSLYNRATAKYSTGQWNQVMNGGPNITLNGIIYVTGNAAIPRGINLTINGALVANGQITLGDQLNPIWKGSPSLTINDPGSGPVGLISKRKVIIGSYSSNVNINGLIYAVDSFELSAYGINLSLNGGIITRQMSVNSLWQNLNFNYNPGLIARTIGAPQGSPIINVEHWEEEY